MSEEKEVFQGPFFHVTYHRGYGVCQPENEVIDVHPYVWQLNHDSALVVLIWWKELTDDDLKAYAVRLVGREKEAGENNETDNETDA